MAHENRPFRRIATIAALAAASGLAALTAFGGAEPVAPTSGVAAVSIGGQERPADRQAGAFDADRAPLADVRGCWTAPIGSTFRFRVVDRVDAAIRSGAGGTQPGGALHTECEVVVTVLDRRAGEALVRQQIEGLQCLGADQRPITGDPVQQSFAAAASEPVLARIDGAGRVLGFGFADGLDGDQRIFLRGTLGLLACEAPAAGATKWTSTVADTTGEFEARHEVLPAGADELVVRRTRVRYQAMARQTEIPAHELSGATEAHFQLRLGWLHSVRVDEGFTLALPLLDLQAITTRRAEVTMIDAGTVAVSADVAGMWQAASAPASGLDEQVGAFAAASQRRTWQQRLQGVTVDQLLADLQRVLGTQPVDEKALDGVFQNLQWLVKLDDTIAAQLVERLTTRQLADDAARTVLGALGAAGTTAAQQALAAVRGDCSLGEPVRLSATLSCVQLAKPDAAIVGGLLQEAASDSGLRGSSLLVLGALTPRTEQVLADGRSPLQALLAMEGDAGARGDLGTWMLAVGNSKAPQTLAIAQRLFDHRDPAVRAACCVAIRGVTGALDTLVQRGLGDSDPTVRYEAVLALSRRGEPAARTALERASSDADEAVRNRARKALGLS